MFHSWFSSEVCAWFLHHRSLYSASTSRQSRPLWWSARSEGSTFKHCSDLSSSGLNRAGWDFQSRIQGSRFNGVCDGANKRWAGWRWTVQDLCSCLRASNDRDQINEECGIYRMPNSVGKRFKPTKYIPVSTTATLLVGSTTLFFVFT